MKKETEREAEQKRLFEDWLAAYNHRLVQVAQGSPGSRAAVREQATDAGSKPEPPSGTEV